MMTPKVGLVERQDEVIPGIKERAEGMMDVFTHIVKSKVKELGAIGVRIQMPGNWDGICSLFFHRGVHTSF